MKLFQLTPINQRRFQRFKSNRRGWYSLWFFLILFFLSLFAELLANDKPLMVKYDGQFYFPIFKVYAETEFGGDLPTEADYRDEFVVVRKMKKIDWLEEEATPTPEAAE